MRLFFPHTFALLLVFTHGFSAANENGDGNKRPPLNDDHFLADAYEDAINHYPEGLTKPMSGCRFSIFQGYAVDLDDDGENEYVVAGNIAGQRIQVVLAYTWSGENWQSHVLNRARGGGIDGLQIVDINDDGFSEIYSVLRDDGLRRYCRIFSMDENRKWRDIFVFDSKGGFTNSCNISLEQASGGTEYRVRVDEVNYPDSDEGEVEQRTYFFQYDNGEFVMNNKHTTAGSKL